MFYPTKTFTPFPWRASLQSLNRTFAGLFQDKMDHSNSHQDPKETRKVQLMLPGGPMGFA
jgi:hypothetical protein